MSLKSNLLRALGLEDKTSKQLKNTLGADGKKVKRALEELRRDKKVRVKKGVYSLTQPRPEPVEARLVKLGRSFGFCVPADGKGDIFVPGHSLLGAMPGDTVEVCLSASPRVEGSREGEVMAILQPNDKVVGTVEEKDGRLMLRLDNAKDTLLAIRKTADGGVKPGEKAAGVILERGDRHDEHRVGITLRFGSAESARQCAKAILFGAGVEKTFPSAVKAAAKEVTGQKISKEDIKARKDLRKEVVFTIDGAHTKDIDDAISARRVLDGYRLSVHIADVSHYVNAKSVLDAEAQKRGTSIYFADTVIPMLPRQLSNGICSLNPGEDRLAFSCVMTLDAEARLLDYRFVKSVIQSRVQGVYSEVNALFEGAADDDTQTKYAEVSESVEVMEEIYRKLAKLRQARGSMEIETEEPVLNIDEEGRCVGVEKQVRGEAERMIEEFMLLANTAAAHLARRAELPFIYRVHDKPSGDRVDALKALLVAAGIDFTFKEGTPTQQELAKLLDETRGTNLERPVHNGVLRSMAKADYEPRPGGHFGLALEDYAHFTSPIRRYPDLAIHRILTDHVGGASKGQLAKRYQTFAEEASALSSETEVRAQQVERNCDASYKAEYMKQYIGDVFDGVVSSVTRFGVYVELDNTVEGLVPVAELSDGPMELVEGVALTDTRTGKSYRLGDALRVQLAAVDISQGNIDFVPAR